MTSENRPTWRMPNIVFPLVLIVIGLVFLLRNLGVLTGDVYQTILSLWPVLLIILGIDSLIREKSIGGPVFLIGLGSIFLLANFGMVGAGVWSMVLRLWPILIVAFGVDVLLGEKNLYLAFLGVILVLAILFGALWLSGVRPGAPGVDLPGVEINYPLGGAAQASVSLEPAVGSLYLAHGISPDALLEGKVFAQRGEQIKESFTTSADEATLRLNSTGQMMWFADIEDGEAAWSLRLNPAVITNLEVSMGVGEIELDLGELLVSGLVVDQGIGALQISLPEAGLEGGKLNLAIGKITIEVPEGVGLQIEANTALGGVQAPESYLKEGNIYSSPNYSTADVRIYLNTSLAIGSLVIIAE